MVLRGRLECSHPETGMETATESQWTQRTGRVQQQRATNDGKESVSSGIMLYRERIRSQTF